MLMLCPNCHSNDVITMQDQLICVNCGHLLTPAEVVARKKKEPKAVSVAKRRPGRPHAVRLDAPVIAQTTPSPPTKKTSLIHDIRPPVRPKTPVVPPPKVPRAKTKKASMDHESVIYGGLRALGPTWIILALPGAALVVGGLVSAILVYLNTARSQQGAGLVIALCFILSGMVWLRFIRSAVMFQRAGVYDHRLAGIPAALRISAARTGRLSLFNLRHGAATLAELAALVIVVWYGGRITVVSSLFEVGLVFALCFALLYLLGSLWVVQRLVEAGIIISNLKLSSAHWLGWRLWRKHWELLGARFAALIVIIATLTSLALGIKYGPTNLGTTDQAIIGLVIGVLAAAMLTVISGGAAEASYRELVRVDFPKRSSRLLGQRHSAKPTRGAMALLISALVLPLVAAGAIAILWR
jgi:Zn ribbon nucleic-acid-binding protein